MRVGGLIFASMICALGSSAAELPSSAFVTAGPRFDNPSISPDGRYLTAISNIQGTRFAFVVDLEKGTPPVPVLDASVDARFQVDWCRFAKATRIVCFLKGPTTADGLGLGYNSGLLVSIDADGKNLKRLQMEGAPLSSYFDRRIVDWTDDDPEHVFVGRGEQLAKMNIQTGEYSYYFPEIANFSSRRRISDVYSDGHGRFQLAFGKLVNESGIYYVPGEEKGAWRPLTKTVGTKWRDDEAQLRPIRVDSTARKAYAIGLHEDRDAIWEIDLTDRSTPTLFFEHPLVDVNTPYYVGSELIGFEYSIDRPFAKYLNREIESVVRSLSALLPGKYVRIESWTSDRQKIVVKAVDSTGLASYYLCSLRDGKVASLGTSYPELSDDRVARTRLLHYKASDGVEIGAYLTEPAGVRAKNSPMIVFPHDVYESPQLSEFDSNVQLLASLGYTVLRTSFRGTPGLGREWRRAAGLDWGGLPYADTVDATRWAIAQGFADPARVCILGSGYGGYMALIASMRNSDLFKCAVSINGRNNMFDLAAGISASPKADQVREKYVDPKKLHKDAPISSPENVKIPVLLVQLLGPEVTRSESERMALALKRHDKPHRLVEIKSQDYFWKEPERIRLADELNNFLLEHIGR